MYGDWIMSHEIDAMVKLYPNIVTIMGDTAYDIDGNVVTYDTDAVAVETRKLEAKWKRYNLLLETDWWAVGDRTMTQAERDYRQALRDVPTQEGFPDNITWPTKP